ncbi:MAG: hypothetical protein KKH12_10465 [Gammaproteobacteria bacterium]|nr:hypothetical protein [Gammaproteobacteria bacterium]MBU1482084.1 hypothetical protein [Gammaproteobacteria bacterium]
MMGFFGKKAAPAATQVKAASKLAPIAITGVGLACHAGDQPYELISSILGQISGTVLSDEYKFMSDDGTYLVPRMAPVVMFGNMPSIVRMYSSAATALNNVTTKLSINVSTILVVLIVDPDLLMHNSAIDSSHLQRYLIDEIPHLETATFRILSNNTGSSTSALRTAIAELNEGKWQAVIFGGSDSMISIDACIKLDEEEHLNAIGKTEGLVPGEGAAFVVLQSAETAKTNASPALAYLQGLGIAAEPNARDADLTATEGLSTAINLAIAQAGIAATDIQGIVHGLGAETVQAIEWYQASKKIWPRRIDEQQRMAVQLGEIDQADTPDDPIPKIILPYMTMGEVGAAAMPMHLATALAWMEYDKHQARWGFPVRKHLLICDTPDVPERGALIISTTQDAAN